MQTSHPDINWVHPQLAISGRHGALAVAWLAEQAGVSRVIDLRSEECDDAELLAAHGIELLSLPTPDTYAVSAEMLWRGVRWACELIEDGGRVLVHCEHGIGRSALLVCCILISLGHAPLEALRLAKQVRRKVSPSPVQLEALIAWSLEWHACQSTICPPTTWKELAGIAYEQVYELPSAIEDDESRKP